METKPKEKERKKKGKWKRVEKEEKRRNMKENIEWKYWMKILNERRSFTNNRQRKNVEIERNSNKIWTKYI